jgi:hypothetical protein
VVAVTDGDLGDVGDFGDGGLRGLLVGQQGGRVDGSGGESDRGFPGVDALFLGVLEELSRPAFGLL